MKLSELQEMLRKCWTKGTSGQPSKWTPENPAWGQCGVTALVVQDFFGGKLLRGWIESEEYIGSHYWNLLPNGREIDFTWEQFSKDVTRPKGELRSREYVLSYPKTVKRYTLFRLAVENLIRPNPLFSDPIYRLCFETILEPECQCQKMKFACIVLDKNGVPIVKTCNKTIKPLKHLCEPECIRFKIKSRTHSMIGACGHAEEWALWETAGSGIPLEECSFYIAGFYAKDNKPYIKKEKIHTCLRCAVQMYMAQVGLIYVPVIDDWEPLTPDRAVKTAIAYALEEKSI